MEKKVEVATISGDFDDTRSSYSVESPPPAYHKPDMPTVKVAKIIAATILAVTFLAAIAAVGIVYIQHSMKCADIAKEAAQASSVSALVGDAIEDAVSTDEESKPVKVVEAKGPVDDVTESSATGDKKKLNFPIHIDMDDITGRMMEKNQKARLNCFIEKKRTEEIIPRSSKTLQTPFGNLTTDPKFTHVTGETLSLTCRSGNEKVSKPTPDTPAPSTPILIQIPLQRRPQMPFGHPAMMQQQQQEQRIPLSFLGPMGPFGVQQQLSRPEQDVQPSQGIARQQPPPALQQLLHAMLEPLRIPLRQMALPGMNSMPLQMQENKRMPEGPMDEQDQRMNNGDDQQQQQERLREDEEEESDEGRMEGQKQSNEDEQGKASNNVPGIQRIPLRIFPQEPHMQQQEQHHHQQQQQQLHQQGPPDMQMHQQQGPQRPQQGRDEPITFESQQRQDMPPFLQPGGILPPMPIFVPNHNVQPRSPDAGHRMKRMTGTGSCSCLCE